MDDKTLDALVETLGKTTKLSVLLEMEKTNVGLIPKFWRKHYPTHFHFCDWIGYMQSKDVPAVVAVVQPEPEAVSQPEEAKSVDDLLEEIRRIHP